MEHLLAKGVDRAIQFVHRKRIEGWKGEGEPFFTDGNRRRFSALASMVAGRDLEVTDIRGDTPPRPYWPVLYKMAHPALLPEHGLGWSDGETIFLPVSVVEMESEKAREELVRLLLFFLAFQTKGDTLEVGRRNKTLLESDRLVADLFWIIENTRLFYAIRDEYPGVVRAWPALAGALLSVRPSGRLINAVEKEVEGFLKETVEATFSSLAPLAPVRSAEDSLKIAVELKKRWAGEGVKTGRYRAIVPFFPWGMLIAVRIT